MTRQFLIGATVVCVLSFVVLAQKQVPAPAPVPGQTGSSSANRVSVSGCLERAAQLLPSAATTEDSLSFVLIKPTERTPIGTSGAADNTAASLTRDRMYRLDAPVDQLSLHVGHKVEVTGTLAETATAPAGAGSSTNVPRLRVESIRMLDLTCPR